MPGKNVPLHLSSLYCPNMKKDGRKIWILDCTLRDGSYNVEYQFTVEDTFRIAKGLVKAGYRYIEIGHGTGLGSSRQAKSRAAESDSQYLSSARSAIEGSQSLLGMFFIPGIGTMADIDLAAEYKMDFIRIGTDVTEVEKSAPFIEKAKKLGMQVSSNLMKSYAISDSEFVKFALKAESYGSDIISVVDSAGGMFPDEVGSMITALKEKSSKKIGFHGHNNLHLAIINSVAAIRAGADIVDGTLQGIGRSAGNAQTEILVYVLEKLGYQTGIDPLLSLDLGERLVKPFVSYNKGVDDIGVISGIAKFHSSFMPLIERKSKEHDIDARLLIQKVSERELISVSEALVEEVANNLKNQGARPRYQQIFDSSEVSSPEGSKRIEEQKTLFDLITNAKKTGRKSVLSLTINKQNSNRFPSIRMNESFVIGNVELENLDQTQSLIREFDGKVDWILLDRSNIEIREADLQKHISQCQWTWYSEASILESSVLVTLRSRNIQDTIAVLGSSNKENLLGLIQALNTNGFKVVTELSAEKLGAVVLFGHLEDENKLSSVLNGDIPIYLVRAGALAEDVLGKYSASGRPFYRIDSGVGLCAEVSLAIEGKSQADSVGSIDISGIKVTAGGLIGSKGCVVINSILRPTRVVGIADGTGGLLSDQDEHLYAQAKQKVEAYLLSKL